MKSDSINYDILWEVQLLTILRYKQSVVHSFFVLVSKQWHAVGSKY